MVIQEEKSLNKTEVASEDESRKLITPKSIMNDFEGPKNKYYVDGLMIAKLKKHPLLSSPP